MEIDIGIRDHRGALAEELKELGPNDEIGYINFNRMDVTPEIVDEMEAEMQRKEIRLRILRIYRCGGLFLELLKPSIASKLPGIDLWLQEFDDSIANSLAKHLCKCSSLTNLEINFCNWTSSNESCEALGLAIAQCSNNLTRFVFGPIYLGDSNLKLTRDDIDAILRPLSHRPRLEYLRLDSCQLSKKSVSYIASMCSQKLTKIEFNCCSSGETGWLDPLAEVLPLPIRLRTLEIFAHSFLSYADEERTEKSIANALADNQNRMGNTSIQKVNLISCNGDAAKAINFYVKLNAQGFRGHANIDMKPLKWFRTLIQLKKNVESDDCPSHIFYFLRYDPAWWCMFSPGLH